MKSRFFSLIFGALALAAPAAGAAERMDLWNVVHYGCGGADLLLGVALPCLKLDRAAGYAVLRAPTDQVRLLTVPTQRIEGIESPALLRPDAPPYWAYAWNSRAYVVKAAPRPLGWSDIGMAINSRASRSQDQLHIHVACLDPRVKAALAAHPPAKSGWTRVDFAPWAGAYRVRRIELADLNRNLFKMVADEIPGARRAMASHSLAVAPIGAERNPVFALLDNGRDGHAEELLDLQCREPMIETNRDH